MIFQQSLFANNLASGRNAFTAQWQEVRNARQMAANHNLALNSMAGLRVNEGLIPRDVYVDFDNVTVERMRLDDGDTFLNDLLPNSRSVNIGKLIQKFRRSSDAGHAQTSMTGQIGVIMDQVEWSYDGSIVPIHDAGFKREFREWEAMNSEGFDGLIDDNRETVATVRRRLADSFLDGHYDKAENLIVVDALSWQGMRSDTRVAQADFGVGGINFDFTDQTQTPTNIKLAFIEFRDILRITNKCSLPAKYYVSETIASNFERKFSTYYESKTIMQELSDLMGVDELKVTNKLIGNQMMGFVNSPDFVRPVVGMSMNTVAMPRTVYNADYQFVVWAAIGWQVRTDYFGNSCAIYGSA